MNERTEVKVKIPRLDARGIFFVGREVKHRCKRKHLKFLSVTLTATRGVRVERNSELLAWSCCNLPLVIEAITEITGCVGLAAASSSKV